MCDNCINLKDSSKEEEKIKHVSALTSHTLDKVEFHSRSVLESGGSIHMGHKRL